MNEAEARAERTRLLDACDWTQGEDAELTGNEKARWKYYRRLLRRVPQQPGFPDVIDWPGAPERDAPTPPSDQMVAP
jgi:hypothetical protein